VRIAGPTRALQVYQARAQLVPNPGPAVAGRPGLSVVAHSMGVGGTPSPADRGGAALSIS